MEQGQNQEQDTWRRRDTGQIRTHISCLRKGFVYIWGKFTYSPHKTEMRYQFSNDIHKKGLWPARVCLWRHVQNEVWKWEVEESDSSRGSGSQDRSLSPLCSHIWQIDVCLWGQVHKRSMCTWSVWISFWYSSISCLIVAFPITYFIILFADTGTWLRMHTVGTGPGVRWGHTAIADDRYQQTTQLY